MEKLSPDEVTIAPYCELLRIGKPWEVRTVKQDVMSGRLEFDVGWSTSAALKCPECGRECSFHELGPERSWRHLHAMKALTVVRARVPRCHCQEHGVKAVRTPWTSPGIFYTEILDGDHRNYLATISMSLRLVLLRRKPQGLYIIAMKILRPIVDAWRRPLVARAISRTEPTPSTVTLPFDREPPYRAYQCLGAHPLSVLGSACDLRPLLASDYINFSCGKVASPHGSLAAIVPWRTIGWFVSLGYCELFNVKEQLSLRVTKSAPLIQWMIDRLRDKWYLFAHVNTYYLPDTWAYKKMDFLHDCVILGFDTEKRAFKVATYLLTGEYGVVSVPFSYMSMALTLRGGKYFAGHSMCFAPLLLAVRPAAVKIPFNQNAACKNLDNYLHSLPPEEGIYVRNDCVYAGDWMQTMGYPRLTRIYGLGAFYTLVSHIRLLATKGLNVDMKDVRALWEHKKIMHSNIETWGTRMGISDADRLARSYMEVVNWGHRLHWICMDYSLDKRKDGREILLHLDRSEDTIDIEKQILSQCYWKIRRTVRP